MPTSRLTEADITNLFANPPGDGISITQDADKVLIHIKAGMAKKWGCLLGLISVPCLMIALASIGVSMDMAFEAESPNWWLILLLACVGLPSGVIGVGGLVMLMLPSLFKTDVELHEDRVRITDRGSTVDVPWSDIKAVCVLRRKKPGRQLHAKLDWPAIKGDGDGIAIETPHGSFESMSVWHHEVCEWVARLLYAHPRNSDLDWEVFEKSLIESAGLRSMPTRVDRKTMVVLGLCAIAISIVFIWMITPSLLEYVGVKRWQATTAIIESVDEIKKKETKPTLSITYRYEHNGQAYTSDRYSFDMGYSAPDEREKKKLVVGDTIEVWYDPASPEHAVIDPGFPITSAIFSFVCTGIGLAGIGVLIYGCGLAIYAAAESA